MVEKVLETIMKYNLIENGENVIVGFSGGPDSICLLHILYTVSERMKLKLYAVHINHMLRGSESDEDEAFARSYCESIGIPIHVKAYDINKMAKELGVSGEEAGREARYSEFARFADSLGGAKIAVAHNKNDQAETLIMRIIRGTGIDGLKGMSYQRGDIIRPLLDIERGEIENYCIINKLNPKLDSTNLKSIYTRNKVRLELIPYINKTFETDIVESLYRMSKVVGDDCLIIEDTVEKAYKDSIINMQEEQLELDIHKLNILKRGIARRTIRNGVKQIKGNLNGIESIHIDNVIKLIEEGRTGAVVQLPNGLRAIRSYNTLKLYRELPDCEKTTFQVNIKVPGVTSILEAGSSIESKTIYKTDSSKSFNNNSDNSIEQFFDYEKLIVGINIRNRKDGDIFKPLKSCGTKKLKKYFIDEKIPRDIRDKIPLVAIENEIVWVIGFKINDNFKVTDNTKIVLCLKYIPSATDD